MKHETDIHPSAAGWQAVCSCGWQDGWRRSKNTASKDARIHRQTESMRAGQESAARLSQRAAVQRAAQRRDK